jgi:hypothetical protein
MDFFIIVSLTARQGASIRASLRRRIEVTFAQAPAAADTTRA